VQRESKPEEVVMAGDGGRVPDVSEQRAEKNHVCYIENGRCQFPGCFRRRSDDPASVLAALLAESPEATVAAIEALLTSDEARRLAGYRCKRCGMLTMDRYGGGDKCPAWPGAGPEMSGLRDYHDLEPVLLVPADCRSLLEGEGG
jgi:hypothetical protein